MFLKIIEKIIKPQIVLAHCDVPCGIYDPKAAQVAAATVVKMVDKIINPPPLDEKDKQSRLDFHNNMTRFVIKKEEQAEICKKELLILWTDFFKEENLEMFPKLHETFWKAAKLCSVNKQSVSLEAAQELVGAVDEIVKIFERVKVSSKK